MSPLIQFAAAAFAVLFVAFLAYAALTEGRTRPPARGSREPRDAREQRQQQPGSDARSGGTAFRREALAAADDPLLGPPNKEDRS